MFLATVMGLTWGLPILIASAVAFAGDGQSPLPPTPEDLYAASGDLFAPEIVGLQLVFEPKSSGVAIASPETSGPIQYRYLVGRWDAVAGRLGPIRDENGTMSFEGAFHIDDEERAPYLVVATADTPGKNGERNCASLITSLAWRESPLSHDLELVPTRVGALAGCDSQTLLFDVDAAYMAQARSVEESIDRVLEPEERVYAALGRGSYRAKLKRSAIPEKKK